MKEIVSVSYLASGEGLTLDQALLNMRSDLDTYIRSHYSQSDPGDTCGCKECR